MQTINAVFDGSHFKPMEPIPVKANTKYQPEKDEKWL